MTKTLTKTELKRILRLHALFLADPNKGEKANLSEHDLDDADLSAVNLSGADLSRVGLNRTNLRYANLRGADLSGASFFGANLVAADLDGANIHGANLEGAQRWENSPPIPGWVILQGRLYREECVKAAECLKTTETPPVEASPAKIPSPDDLGAVLRDHAAFLSGERGGKKADMSGRDLRGVNLSRVNMSGADLSGADLSGAYLVGANLRRANLRGADLNGAARSPNDAPIPGWAVVNGRLKSEFSEPVSSPEPVPTPSTDLRAQFDALAAKLGIEIVTLRVKRTETFNI